MMHWVERTQYSSGFSSIFKALSFYLRAVEEVLGSIGQPAGELQAGLAIRRPWKKRIALPLDTQLFSMSKYKNGDILDFPGFCGHR